MNKKLVFGIIGGVVVVVLLAGAAFVAMRMFNPKIFSGFASKGPRLSASGGGGEMFLKSSNGGSSSSVQIHMKRASELPATSADLVGMVSAINGNSLSVSQGKMMMISKNGSAPVASTPDDNSSSPATEVVLTKDTKIWRDTTMDNAPKPSGGNTEMTLQQTVETADVSFIVTGYPIQVWGQKRGDRLVADVVVVTAPVVFSGGKAP